jgi:hypothetical protein
MDPTPPSLSLHSGRTCHSATDYVKPSFASVCKRQWLRCTALHFASNDNALPDETYLDMTNRWPVPRVVSAGLSALFNSSNYTLYCMRLHFCNVEEKRIFHTDLW